MFERFTERARRVVVLAQDEARRLRHNYIGTEHLLLGLIREREGAAAQALRECGATLGGVRERVEGIVGYGEDDDVAQAPFTPRSKRVLEAALRESMRLAHNHIDTEHLLLGLLDEPEGVAGRALADLGVDAEDLRQEVLGRSGARSESREQGLGPLGWTREALQRSFGRYPGAEDRAAFERFTERARRVVVLAQDEARHFNHDYIGTEHLLLGLIREENGIAGQVLGRLGLRLDEAREQVEAVVGWGEEGSTPRMPFTPRTNRVFQLAVAEAAQLGHDYVGTEHLLLGLVEEGEGVAARVLTNGDTDPDAVRHGVLAVVTGGQTDVRGPYLGSEPYRTRITGIEVWARYGGDSGERAERRPFRVDLEVVHEVPGMEEAGVLAENLGQALEPIGFTVLESLVDRVGEQALVALPMADRITVTVTPVPATEGVTQTSVARTFERW